MGVVPGVPRVSVETIQPYLVSRFPSAVVSDFRFLAAGWESDVYAVDLELPRIGRRPLVLRCYRREDGLERMLRETAVLPVLAAGGMPVPGVFHCEPDPAIIGCPFALLDRVPGSALWGRLLSVSGSDRTRLLQGFASLMARLHRMNPDLPVPAEGRGLRSLLLQLESAIAGSEVRSLRRAIDWLGARLGGLTEIPAVVHLDFHPNNVLCDDSRGFGVIDWTQCTVADARLDPAWAVTVVDDLAETGWGTEIRLSWERESGLPVASFEWFEVFCAVKVLAVDSLSGPAAGRLLAKIDRITGT